MTVLEYSKTLEEKRNRHSVNLKAQPSDTTVFLGKNPDTPPSEQAINLDCPFSFSLIPAKAKGFVQIAKH